MEHTSAANDPSQRDRLLIAVPRGLFLAIYHGLGRFAGVLTRLHFSPNFISVLALLAGMAAGALFALGRPVAAGLLVIVCGVLDVLDGKVAVNSQKKTLTGAIFDSTLDRYSEFFIYFGLAIYFRHGGWTQWLPFFSFLGSAMVSYTRARAEGLGIDCRVGLMQRAERIVLIVIAALAGGIFRVFDIAMIIVLVAIALVSNFTAFQRVYHVRKVEIQMKKGKEA
jgi:CDP-diacylglycerol--glycerol-3-phosphate 3-phosphatidyltransferase